MDFRKTCNMTSWGPFSPCSATCGKSIMVRARYPLDKEAYSVDHRKRVVEFYNNKSRLNMKSEDNSNERETEDFNDNGLGFGSKDRNDPCRFEKTIEEVVCAQINPVCDHGLPREIKKNYKRGISYNL